MMDGIDDDILALLAQCVAEGPSELIEDGEFIPIDDDRF
jgi:hypothetical protein